MPMYEFACTCGRHFDRRVSVDDRNEPQVCPCGEGDAHRVLSADFGFRMSPTGLLNTRNLPNDGVHRVNKRKERMSVSMAGTR